MTVDIGMSLDELISRVKRRPSSFHGGDFLLTWSYTKEELLSVLEAAAALKTMYEHGLSLDAFAGGLAVSNFRDKSTRTRFSFASASTLLGLTPVELDESKSQISHGETARETAVMISFLTEVIGIRDDMFVGKGHEYMLAVSEALDESYRAGVLPQRPAVINLQCDRDHPTQTLADLLHLVEWFGGFERLKGRKIAMTWAYSPSYGKPLSVPQGIITLMTRFGMNVVLAHPEGYDLLPETLEQAAAFASAEGGSFEVVNSMEEAFRDADVVYPKSWAPFEVMKERTNLLERKDFDGLERLEKECLERNASHRDWCCDSASMSRTRDGRALYMHCLPADIEGVNCEHGEVTAEVFDAYRLHTYREASWKPFVIASMILHTRFESAGEVLSGLLSRNRSRRAGF